MNSFPVGRKKDIVVQHLNDEILIYDLKLNKAFCLNKTAGIVWNLCDGVKTVGEISRIVGERFDSPPSDELVWLALDQLKRENLIIDDGELEAPFTGMSRREAIKTVGIRTMIALPLITSLVAPTVAMAQSGVTGAPNGAFVGIRSTRGNDCGSDPAAQDIRANRCDASFGRDCASGNATFIPGTCTYNSVANESLFQCRCRS